MERTNAEICLEANYGDIVVALERVMSLFGEDHHNIDKYLNLGTVTQTEFDYALLGLIESVQKKSEVVNEDSNKSE